MARKLDKHFKCPRDLKTMFAFGGLTKSMKRAMLEAHAHAKATEYAVEPRSAKSVGAEEKKNQRKS